MSAPNTAITQIRSQPVSGTEISVAGKSVAVSGAGVFNDNHMAIVEDEAIIQFRPASDSGEFLGTLNRYDGGFVLMSGSGLGHGAGRWDFVADGTCRAAGKRLF